MLRKAWKIYQKSYAQIRQLYIKRIGLSGNSIGQSIGHLHFFIYNIVKLEVIYVEYILHINILHLIFFNFILAPPPPSNQPTSAVQSPSSSRNSSSSDSNSTNLGINHATNGTAAGNSTSSGESGSGSSSTYGSPTREIPSIRSTKNYRGVGSRVSHSFSVPLNLFSLVRNNPSVETFPSTNGRQNGEVGIDDLSATE